MSLFIVSVFVLFSGLCVDSFFLSHKGSSIRGRTTASISMHFEEAMIGNTLLSKEALKAERYIATNRFKVRPGKDAKFEKRWADRKSRLAQLEGFRFFTLLKRVDPVGGAQDSDENNYVSMTVWENKDNFDAWRTGEAFKEAHGGGGITDFLQLITTALFILDGKPKPAFYDALLPEVSSEKDLSFTAEGGWRKVEADGVSLLSPDVFVTQNRFNVKAGKEVEFESKWANRESQLSTVPGFVSFYMLRRDASKADDGYNYMSTTTWKSKADFENWKNSEAFVKAHANAGRGSGGASSESIYNAPPKLAMYEGKLALMSPLGA